jgi:hypothetical protein
MMPDISKPMKDQESRDFQERERMLWCSDALQQSNRATIQHRVSLLYSHDMFHSYGGLV